MSARKTRKNSSKEPRIGAAFQISEKDYERLRAIAKKEDRSVSQLLRASVRMFLEKK